MEEAKRYVIARCRSATAFEPDDYAIEFPDGEMYSWSGRDWIGTNIVKHKVGAPAPDHLARVVRGPDRREVVNHPSHYGGDVEHEVIKCLEAWGLEKDALLWNAVKYIARHDKKGDPLENLKKAKFYLDRRIERLLSAWKSDI